jgi:HAD superfamily hydrolase (TIGR01509 family)
MNTANSYSVVFDLGGVLLHWNPTEIINNTFADEATRSVVKREIFQHPDWLDMDRGVLQEHDAIHRFQKRTGRSVADISKLLQTVKDSLRPIEKTHEILNELSQHKAPLYCLSNMATTTADYLRARYAFFKLFHGIVISGEINLIKPDKAIFAHLTERFGLEPERTIFIDDHLPNIESAAELGFKTHHFTDPDRCREALRSQFGFSDVLMP